MRWFGVSLFCLSCALLPPRAEAEGVLRVSFTPTERAQIAIFLENDKGEFIETLALTHATALRGIGNRPGALQMNSGFRWPYGRREGVLPIWAHRRATVEAPFPRVIFQDRISEGYAARNVPDHSTDDYFCLSFNVDRSKKDALDAVSCASVFSSDKGRYLDVDDLERGYAEPFEIRPRERSMRPLSFESLYPPRLDLESFGIYDHLDARNYREDARLAMPTIDAVSMATPRGDVPFGFQWHLPRDLPFGRYWLYVEIHTEGDHNDYYSTARFPTPGTSDKNPTGDWDSWARNFGYPFRGQPSIVYRAPIEINGTQTRSDVSEPFGYGELHGADGRIRPIDHTITDDPIRRPGSGADRLRKLGDQPRLSVEAAFFTEEECAGPLPLADELRAKPHGDERRSHHHAEVSFIPRRGSVPIFEWEVVIAREPIESDEDFERASEANAAELDTVALSLCVADSETYERNCPDYDEPIAFEIGQLSFLTEYFVGVRAFDYCGRRGPIATAQFTTTEINYTTVSPCFVATAAYGTPFADEIVVLRRFRDEVLRPNRLGRAFLHAYEQIGPPLAHFIEKSETRRAIARALLRPITRLIGFVHERLSVGPLSGEREATR